MDRLMIFSSSKITELAAMHINVIVIIHMLKAEKVKKPTKSPDAGF